MNERATKRFVPRPNGRKIEPCVCAVLALMLAGCASAPSEPLGLEEPAHADEVTVSDQGDQDVKARKRYRPKLARSAVYNGGSALPPR